MKKVIVKSPGTCGEYIQGWFEGSPCLISSPIDRYSTITIEAGEFRNSNLKFKAQKMARLIFERYGIARNQWERLMITHQSQIPEKKGMASSTADLSGVAAGLSAYYDLGLKSIDIGRLCAEIEPSDNLMFEKLNLFNHITGQVLKELDGLIEANLMIVDFCGGIDTMTFNESQDDYSQKDLGIFRKIISEFEQGLADNDLKKIGRACTLSAYLNQKRLPKKHLDLMVDLMEECGGLGTVIGHSGTVIGVMYEENAFDKVLFLEGVKKRLPTEDYTGVFENRLIGGGIEIDCSDARQFCLNQQSS
ncbi:GHMP kinase [Eubacteriaceae bacterium ES3]|nr:GHMP kinase [Eubacteriaceae bacterium ES3]